MDRLTKYTHFIPIRETITAEELVYIFIRYVFVIYGIPIKLITNRDKLFRSKF